ncbi:EamA family transporter [Helicobacter sp. XJK30-2]|uniref:Undecaprenyl phosphate-aminoarabinose flippase subunit ArnE n=2 Tax=Helicobacter TaxID=209 RepID=A0A377J4D6_9HELI|nr:MULTISPECIES: EamA family transporter [Helicobacter]MDL0082047.1 EamA family transporter [Helicobacter sp. XJK30-2]STO97357.1 Undecaprenyl phosphate-aminoarabinose flippase subunit ArnE [Helicobacter canis]
MIAFIPLILFSVLLNATAQLLLKRGMSELGELSLSLSFILKGVLNPFILGGLAIYAISIVSWLIVLARVNVSIAYPFLSLGFIFSAVVAYFAFGEPLTLQKILGIALICAGLVFLTFSRG